MSDLIRRLTSLAIEHHTSHWSAQFVRQLCKEVLTVLEAEERTRLDMQTRIDAYVETIRVMEKSMAERGSNLQERQVEALESIATSLLLQAVSNG